MSADFDPWEERADADRAEWANENERAALAARVWDEGHRDGCDEYHVMCEKMGHLDRNPYREVSR